MARAGLENDNVLSYRDVFSKKFTKSASYGLVGAARRFRAHDGISPAAFGEPQLLYVSRKGRLRNVDLA